MKRICILACLVMGWTSVSQAGLVAGLDGVAVSSTMNTDNAGIIASGWVGSIRTFDSGGATGLTGLSRQNPWSAQYTSTDLLFPNTTYTLDTRVGSFDNQGAFTFKIDIGYDVSGVWTSLTNKTVQYITTALITSTSNGILESLSFDTGATVSGNVAIRVERTKKEGSKWPGFDYITLSDGDGSPPPAEFPTIEPNGTNLLFTWPSKSTCTYDLMFKSNLLDSSWTVDAGHSAMSPTPPKNTLDRPYPPGEQRGFFAIQEHSGRTVKVVLLGGQSNMFGATTLVNDLPPALQGSQNDVMFFYKGIPSFENLHPGNGAEFGPEITFGRTIADAFPNELFALIKSAQGGTSLEVDWDPATGPVYTTFRNVVAAGTNALTQAGYTFEIVGMLWTQGEKDANNEWGDLYEANLVAFIADVRSRYGSNLPFYISQLSSQQTSIPAAELALVRQAQANVAAADPNSSLIITDTYEVGGDNLHFSSAGQESLGQGFAEAFIP